MYVARKDWCMFVLRLWYAKYALMFQALNAIDTHARSLNRLTT